jgi:DNA topoisomerase IA
MHSPAAAKLFIVESPLKAKAVKKCLGIKCLVRVVVGHIADRPVNSPIEVTDGTCTPPP